MSKALKDVGVIAIVILPALRGTISFPENWSIVKYKLVVVS